jgi:hypothetical protein
VPPLNHLDQIALTRCTVARDAAHPAPCATACDFFCGDLRYDPRIPTIELAAIAAALRRVIVNSDPEDAAVGTAATRRAFRLTARPVRAHWFGRNGRRGQLRRDDDGRVSPPRRLSWRAQGLIITDQEFRNLP